MPAKRAALVIVAVALAAGSTAQTAQAVDRTWFGGTGDWSVAGNWNPAGVPGSADTAIIDGGSVTLNSAATVAGFTMNGGTFTGSGTLTVTGLLTWAGG